MSDASPEGAVCIPNIKGWGRKRRARAGIVQLAAGVAVLIGFIVIEAPWYLRLVVFLPAAGAALALLQVRRNT